MIPSLNSEQKREKRKEALKKEERLKREKVGQVQNKQILL